MAVILVTGATLGTASHSAVIFAGTPTRTGAMLSSTVMVCTKVVLFPAQSVKVYVLVTIYGFPLQPEAPLLVSATVILTVPKQLSVTFVKSDVFAIGISVLHCRFVILAGTVAVGALVSSIV